MDRLFTNMEAACEVSAALVLRLQEATAEPDVEAVVIGDYALLALLCSPRGGVAPFLSVMHLQFRS